MFSSLEPLSPLLTAQIVHEHQRRPTIFSPSSFYSPSPPNSPFVLSEPPPDSDSASFRSLSEIDPLNDSFVQLGDWQSEGCESWQFGRRRRWVLSSRLTVRRRRRWVRYFVNSELLDSWLLSEGPEGPDSMCRSMMEYIDRERQKYDFERSREMTPTVLLLGGSGSGKSSLVNAVFGMRIAEIGVGLPVTQSYQRFSAAGEDEGEGESVPVVIYDSKGLEHGSAGVERFQEDTREFLDRISKDPQLESHIHCIWFVVDLTQTRVQPFEVEVCKTLLKNIPIVFVFNKADAVRTEVMHSMLEMVEQFAVPSCIGKLATVADRKSFDNVKECPSCGSARIRKRLRDGECTVLCKECRARNDVSKTEGIEELSGLTLSQLPRLVRDAFLNSRRAMGRGRHRTIRQSILESAVQTRFVNHPVRFAESLVSLANRTISQYDLSGVLTGLFDEVIRSRIAMFFRANGKAKLAFVGLGQKLSRKRGKLGVCFALAVGFLVANACVRFIESVAQIVVEEADAGETETETSQTKRKIFVLRTLTERLSQLDGELIRIIAREVNFVQEIGDYVGQLPIDGSLTEFVIEQDEEAEVERVPEHVILTSYQQLEDEDEESDGEAQIAVEEV